MAFTKTDVLLHEIEFLSSNIETCIGLGLEVPSESIERLSALNSKLDSLLNYEEKQLA